MIRYIYTSILNKHLFCLFREFSSGNLTNRKKAKQKCNDDKNEKDGEKNKWFSGYVIDDAFQQTGSNSAQEMHLDGLSESSSSSEKMESENGYELSQLNGKSLL